MNEPNNCAHVYNYDRADPRCVNCHKPAPPKGSPRPPILR